MAKKTAAEKFSHEQIRQYWTEQAKRHKQASAVSWSDTNAINLEIREISKRLIDGENVLDVGCANGYSTILFATQKKIKIRGLDFIPEMVQEANKRLKTLPFKIQGTAEFYVGDITRLKEPSNNYDKLIVIRVLINLVDWDQQLKGILECARVLKKGGLLLLSEATLQGWNNLNKFRKEAGLEEIPMPPFNQYLDQEKLVKAVEKELNLVELVNFSSTYYVGTRVLKPLFARLPGTKIDTANPESEFNKWFAQLPAFGDYGVQKLFVFKKI